MTRFDETRHSRDRTGRFAAHQGAEQPGALDTDPGDGAVPGCASPGCSRPGDAQRAQAARHDRAAAESFERSDTDGFLTQWSNSVHAAKARLQAEIDDQGGYATFPALARLDGTLVPAKLTDTRYGTAWGLLSDPDNPHSRFSGWVNESKSRDPERSRAALAKKGYKVVTVKAKARAALSDGGGRGLSGALNVRAYARRADGGFDPDAEIVGEGDGQP